MIFIIAEKSQVTPTQDIKFQQLRKKIFCESLKSQSDI